MTPTRETESQMSRASRITEITAIGRRTLKPTTGFPSVQRTGRTMDEPRGIGTLAAVCGGLFGGRAASAVAVVERFAPRHRVPSMVGRAA